MVYPFLPALARGLGVPLAAAYSLVTIRNFAGFFSPLFGPISERFGRKPMMVGAMLLFGLSCFLVILWPAYWPLGVTLSLIALAKVVYDPAMQAYLGDMIPYQRRGCAIAVTELAWAGSLLVGAPAVGFVIQRQGWQAPFVWLGALGIGAIFLIWRALPRSEKRRYTDGHLGNVFSVARRHPIVLAATLYMILLMAANETLFIVYGDWMEDSFQLPLTGLGLASGVIGGAEILGEIFVGLFVDRFGKRPVIIGSGILTALLYFLIPHTSTSLASALMTLFALFLFFEISVVASIPLMTEIVPGARATVMSAVVAASALGRTLGALIGPAILLGRDFVSNGLAAAIMMVIAIFILVRWVREGTELAFGETAD